LAGLLGACGLLLSRRCSARARRQLLGRRLSELLEGLGLEQEAMGRVAQLAPWLLTAYAWLQLLDKQ
jgi:hypothetical protein